jgi:hypothetical protein
MIRVLDIDNWREITATMRKAKLRTILTGLGVFLGIVILLLMIGFGRSLENGVKRRMTGFATNAVFVWGQRTTKPYAGLPMGRQIVWNNRDIEALARFPGVLHLAPRAKRGGFMQGSNVHYGPKTGAFQVAGDYPAFQYVQTPVMRAGRFLNQRDLDESRKVAVIGESVVAQLYGSTDPIATYIEVNGIYFQVVGVFGTMQTGQQADRILNTIDIPFTTFQRAFNYNDRVGSFAIVGQPGVNGEELQERVKDHAQAAPQGRAGGRCRDRRVEHVQGVREDEHAVLPDQPGDVGGGHDVPARRSGRSVQHHVDHRPRTHQGDRRAQGAGCDARERGPHDRVGGNGLYRDLRLPRRGRRGSRGSSSPARSSRSFPTFRSRPPTPASPSS